ncbi:MAG: flagellar hook-length control protein FliK [Candidatus Nitrotoga sp.]
MLSANIISALQTLSRSGRPLAETATDTSNQITKLEPGQQLQGSVQSRISEGLFKVQVTGQTLQMRLPGNIRSGDTIKLEVITIHPRITFSMVASTNPLSTPEQIGATARILSNLAELPLERLTVTQPGNKAIWNSGQQALDTRLLADVLREALGKSGLFYESHQAQWIRGERSMNQLLEEPQNILTRQGSQLSSGEQQRAAAQSNALVTSASTGDISAADDTSLPIAKELLLLVQQQLHTLEHHHLAWLGQVWPGQEMQWEIQGQPEHQTQQQDERQWSTEIELALPKLGNVHARLVFAENGLRLTLNAADTATVDLFNRTLPQLKNSLADADIALTAAVVDLEFIRK